MIKAKKSLGQNFLIDRYILEKIVNVVPIKNKIVLEIGPGTGNLTSFILKNNPEQLFVVEKDNDLATNLDEKFKDIIVSKIPSARLGEPEDVANAVLFLASNQSDYINGETLHVNGGMYMA